MHISSKAADPPCHLLEVVGPTNDEHFATLVMRPLETLMIVISATKSKILRQRLLGHEIMRIM